VRNDRAYKLDLAFSLLQLTGGCRCKAKRPLRVPEGIDTDKIAASFKNGILSVTLAKSAEAQKQAKRIEVKGA
jgi:HSP20 family molecular chaperone IbpA